jgi:RND family efflux transporter MFP subunit
MRRQLPHRIVPVRHPRRAAAVLLVFGLAAGAGCGDEPPPAPDPVRPVKMFTVPGGSAAQTREYPGTVRAAQTAEMAFEVSGKIMEFRYVEGQNVPQGEVIAYLDPRDFQAKADSAQAEYDNNRLNFERAQKLVDEGALAPIERDRRKTAFDTSDAKLREATKAFEDTELRAPFTGIMARKLVEDFANVQAKQPVVVLTSDDFLEIKLAVPERDLSGERDRSRTLADINARLEPQVIITSMPDRPFPGELTKLANTADTETRTFEATMAFKPPDGIQVLPGMTARVIIQIPQDQVSGTLIPVTAAVANDAGDASVWVVDSASMTVSRHPVQLGPVSGDKVAVTGGLEGGEVVVISGIGQLEDGMTVRRFER